ncbi:MAG TPA: hypothetical protein VGO92_06285, partial [Acidimicrobiales bacterium]|nr:hypothetical protein [Acidimicrobiales bacterium]
MTAVSAQGKTFYLDDRDFDDTADDAGDPALSATPLGSQSDGYTGGTWVYEETGLHTGLQVGATQWVEGSVPGTLPYVPPQKVSVPGAGPVPPRSQTLFPSGIGGGSVADTTGGKDPCWTERD